MGGARWVAGQRLGIADIDQANNQLEGVDKARAGLQAAGDAKAEDRRRLAAHVALRQRMLGMIAEAGVLHPGDLGVGLKELGHPADILAVALHAQGEGLQALQDQERVERRDRCAHVA